MILVDSWKAVVLERYATFGGRASRPAFWWFVLANFFAYVVLLVIVSVGYAIADGLGNTLVVGVGVYWLATLVPSLAVSVRRLHDTNRTGLLMLLSLLGIIPLFGFFASIALIIFFASAGDAGTNRYGAPDQTASVSATA